MPSLAWRTCQDRLEWFLRMNSVQPYCNSTGCSTQPPGRTCVQIRCQQDTPSFPAPWTEVESLLVGKIDETFLRFAVEEFQTGLHRHSLLGNCIFWQTTGAGNCHLESSVSKLMKEETEPVTIIPCIRHDSPEANEHKQCGDYWEMHVQGHMDRAHYQIYDYLPVIM